MKIKYIEHLNWKRFSISPTSIVVGYNEYTHYLHPIVEIDYVLR